MKLKYLIAIAAVAMLACVCVNAVAQTNTAVPDNAMGVTLTQDEMAKVNDSITQILPLIPHKYQGMVVGAVLLLGLMTKAGRAYVGWKTGGFFGAIKAVFGGSATVLKLLLFLLLPVMMLTGCGINQNTHRAVAAITDGTSAGITENATTGMYELGIKNVAGAGLVVPIFYQTNALGAISVIVPDAVLSSEKGAKASLFGSGGMTYTIAIGSNACQTLLGGQHPPINTPYWTNSTTTVNLGNGNSTAAGK